MTLHVSPSIGRRVQVPSTQRETSHGQPASLTHPQPMGAVESQGTPTQAAAQERSGVQQSPEGEGSRGAHPPSTHESHGPQSEPRHAAPLAGGTAHRPSRHASGDSHAVEHDSPALGSAHTPSRHT